MAASFQRALYKLNVEHQLDLHDPDLAEDPCGNSFDLQLCRDAKDLWQYHHDRWEYVVNRFSTQAPGVRSQWVSKPHGDPTTISFGATSQIATLKDLFRGLLLEEKVRFALPSTKPFSVPEEPEMMLIVAEDDLGASQYSSLTANASRNGLYSNSSDTVIQPGSSWLDEFKRLEQGDDTLLAKDYPVIRESNDDMAMDYEDRTDPHVGLRYHSDALCGQTSEFSRENSYVRKRPASNYETEKALRKPKTFDDDQLQQSRFDDPAFSFTKPRESLTVKVTRQALYCAPSVDTSFRSVSTDANGSFLTNATTPSSSLQTSNRASNANAPSVLHPDSTEPPSDVQKYLHKFKQASPFDDSIHSCPELTPFSAVFETQRVALHNGFNPCDIFKYLRSQNGLLNHVGRVTDLDHLWAALAEYTNINHGLLPARSASKAWKASLLPRDDLQYGTLSLTGIVSFGSSPKEPLLDIKLNPLSLEQSNRLKRKYGSDRLLVLRFPSLEAGSLPSHPKADASNVRTAFIEWLTTSSHYLLGREWKAFYVKPKPRTKSTEKPTHTWRVCFFAVDGYGFKNYVDTIAPKYTSIEQMLDWFFCIANNQDQLSLKLFSRLQLLVSDTTPTFCFSLSQIIQKDDIWCQGILMTDGCARISYKAAQLISRQLGLPLPIPSAFQARIAGAKGMWLVDTSLEPHNGSDVWIEMYPSQIKFESLHRERGHPDMHRITFEVHDYSRPLRPAPINFQLLPILIDRNVDAKIFTELLENDLNAKVTELGESMSQPQALRAWNQEQYPTAGTRLASNGVVWNGGMPDLDEEAINALAEAGFVPETCAFLEELCKSAVKLYCTRVEKRMYIYPGQATFAYMVPDFWGVLEEDQIHLGFSSAFTDRRSQWSDTMLYSIDVLVARLPAHLPSDIHKVRAVFSEKLAHIKDVVVFPTKGKFCLADKLSGGDYDGDKAWICWNDAVVGPFKNFDSPPKRVYSDYGIRKDHTVVKDVWQPKNKQDKDSSTSQATQAAQFIRQGFEFNMRQSLLGQCTNLHEAYCYNLVLQASKNSVSKTNIHAPRRQVYSPMRDHRAMDFANLLGHLVDTAKNGYIFTDEDRRKYLASIGAKRLPDPAYKTGGTPSDHIIDQLVLQTVVSFRQNALKKLDLVCNPSGTRTKEYKDKDLLTRYQKEKHLAQKYLAEDPKDKAVSIVLQFLARDVNDIYNQYKGWMPEVHNGQVSWNDVYKSLRRCFLDLQPASGIQNETNLDGHPVIERWRESAREDESSAQRSWYLLAASALYSEISLGSFPWRACGKELMVLKLLANNDGVPITRQMHQYMRFDRRMWENAKLRDNGKSETDQGDVIGELNVEEFMGFNVEMMYEWQAEAE